MLHGRLRDILRLLMAAEAPVTSSFFAAQLNVTTRTVRNDIKELQGVLSGHGAFVQSVRGSGYKLRIDDEQVFRTLLQDEFQQKKGLPVLPEERMAYLMKRLLLADHYLKLDELAEELFISKSTLQTDLKEVKKRLLPYRIVMETRPNYGFKLRGDEVQMRYCMAEYIVDERETEIDVLNEKADILPKEEIEIIRSAILKKMKNDRIPLSNMGLNNLIIHIAIACKRIRTENYVSLFPKDMDHILHQKEYQAAEAIVKELESALAVTFPKDETAYITMHLLGTKRMTQSQCGEDTFSVEEETDQLTLAMIEAVDRELKLGILHDKELKIGLALHMKPAISRNRYGMNLRNPMLAAIKEHYPLAFEAGIIAGIVIKEQTGIEIHENEIGYLALHFGAAIERKKQKARRNAVSLYAHRVPEAPSFCAKNCVPISASGSIFLERLSIIVLNKCPTNQLILSSAPFRLKKSSLYQY